jgi:DNA-binding transcriptional MerR regulator
VEAEALLRARELGASLEDIAEALVITRQGVAYKLKALAENTDDDEAEEARATAQAATVIEVEEPEVIEVEEPEVIEVAEVSDEPEETGEAAQNEVVDVRGPETTGETPEIDFRRPHTKA